MSAEALEATFVQRDHLARRLLDLIRASAHSEARHHILLVGPRGIGKTHLVSLLYHRIQAEEELRDHLRIAWMREEEWGVASFLDLLLRILRALVEEYRDSDLGDRVEELYELDRRAAAVAAERLLEQWLAGRVLLLLVENLDDLFTGLGSQGQKQLRALVQSGGVTAILATTPALFQGVARRVSPFYGFFRIHHLDRLTVDQAVELVMRSLRYRGAHELAARIASGRGRARIRVIHHLAGGNHRVYAIFAQFLTVESLDRLIAPVLRTLDDLTPYYQAKVVQLAPLQRKIVEVLCDRRGALSVQRIAKLCFVSPQTASGQLTALRRLGYVVRETYGRQSYYELSEPLMRLSVEIKKSRGEPLRLLVDFLRLWFSGRDLESRLTELESDQSIDRRYLERALETASDTEEPPEIAQKQTRFKEQIDQRELEGALETAESLIDLRGSSSDWHRLASCLYHRQQFEEGLRAIGKALELNPSQPWTWNFQGLLLVSLGQESEALECFEKAGEIEPNNGAFQNNIGASLVNLGDYEKAQEVLARAIELTPDDLLPWHNQGRLLAELGRYEEAAASWSRAIELDGDDPWYWRNRGVCRWRLGQQEEALDDLIAALERRRDIEQAWIDCAFLLLEQGLFESAIDCHRTAVGLAGNVRVLGSLAVLLYRCGRRQEALAALREALEEDPKDLWLMNNKGVALCSLGRYERALETFDAAIAEAGADDAGLCLRFNRTAALIAVDRDEEAARALDEALELITATEAAQTSDDTALVRNLLMSGEETARWSAFLEVWLDRFADHQASNLLGHGLVHSIPAATSEWLPLVRADAWLETWSTAAAGIAELALPLRLLAAAVDFRRSSDPRVLYTLAREEREILRPLLRFSESPREGLERRVRRLLRLRP
jgi:tetratricopeptide (TPR) repeat protein